MVQFRVTPGLSFKVVDEDIAKLGYEVPPSKNHQLFFLCHEGCSMTASSFRRVAFSFGLTPFKGIKVEFIEVVEGSPLVVDTSMSSKNDNLIFEVGHGVVGSWFGSTDLGHGILGRANGLLVGRLEPLELGELKVVGVVEAII